MKKLILSGSLLMFGTFLMKAQTNKQDNLRSAAEKNLKSTEFKMDTFSQNRELLRKTDTASFNQNQKLQRDLRNDLEKPKDGLNNEAVKPTQPAPGRME